MYTGGLDTVRFCIFLLFVHKEIENAVSEIVSETAFLCQDLIAYLRVYPFELFCDCAAIPTG